MQFYNVKKREKVEVSDDQVKKTTYNVKGGQVRYAVRAVDDDGISQLNTSGFRGQVWYKFYIGRDTEAPKGFYVGPHISYGNANLVVNDDEANKLGIQKINFNGVIGYQIISGGGFALDVFTGLGVKNIKYTIEGETDDIIDGELEDKFTPAVAFGLNFGYAF